MRQKTAIVVAGGVPIDVAVVDRLPADAIVIAADSGAAQAARLGLHVDLVVGDLDSLAPGQLDAAVAGGAAVERHRPDKDKTDLELALDAAVERGVERIVVVAGQGGRLDHALANLLLLASADYETTHLEAIVGHAHLHVVRAGPSHELEGTPGELVSLLAVNGPARDVYSEGLAWALTGDDLLPGSSRGVSNVFLAPTALVSIGEGVLLAIVPGELADPAGFSRR